jgi:hypothetical protein
MSVETVLKAEDRAQAKRMVANGREASKFFPFHEPSSALITSHQLLKNSMSSHKHVSKPEGRSTKRY